MFKYDTNEVPTMLDKAANKKSKPPSAKSSSSGENLINVLTALDSAA